MTAAAFAQPPPERFLAPSAPVGLPVARWVWVALGLGLLLRIVAWVVGRDLTFLWQPPVVLAGCVLGHWFEERCFYRFSERRGPLRMLLLLMQSGAWLAGLSIAALLLLARLPGEVVGLTLAIAVVWFSSASLGSFTTLLLDQLLSATRTRFRTRLMLAIFVLMFLAVCVGLLAGAMALWVVDLAWSGKLDMEKFTIDTGEGKLAGVKAVEWLRLHVSWVLAASSGLAVVLGVPSWLSAAAKLADAAMERLRPLSRAFDEIANGKRDVRVQEAGSVDFIELNRRFNAMVKTLGDAERMEDAFGRYVSKKVLERIRAQHGEAVIPAQLREATVFFADVRGYTALSERLSPHEVVALLNRYLGHVVELVEKHEGYLNKFIGDAVVVVFNGPVEQADHAERAVRCAVELQAMVKEQNASGTFKEAGELKIGVGIATGPMVCGNVGGPSQMEYTVIGDTVNLSARLTSAAGPAEVWVSEATAQAVREVKFEALPEIKVKGKEKPLVPYRVSLSP